MRRVRLPVVVVLGATVLGAIVGLYVLAAGALGPPLRASAQGAGPALYLYSEENFGGRCLVVTGTLLDVPKEELRDGTTFYWNDNVKSVVVVSGTWRLCQHGRLNTRLDDTALEELTPAAAKAKGAVAGWSCLVSGSSSGPVEYPTAANGVWGPDISSIELVSERNLPDWAWGELVR